MTSVLCFYHSPCNDGSASAAALQYRLQLANVEEGDYDIRFCPLTYNTEWDEPLPQTYLENEVQPKHAVREIYFIDICISPLKFNQIYEHLRQEGRISSGVVPVICIDHHQSAIDKLEVLQQYCTETYIKIGPGLSGATLVWGYFNQRFDQDLEAPLLLRYVADQDIWEWKLEDSRDVNAALNVLNGTVDAMEQELSWALAAPDEWLAQRRTEGKAINAMVESQLNRSSRQVVEIPIADATLLVVNATSFSSELGNYLCEHHENSPEVVAMIYAVQDNWVVRCSLRSIPGGVVTARQLAERYGGGGHDHASGCRFENFDQFTGVLDRLRLK